MMLLTLGQQTFSLDQSDALFVAEAILMLRKNPKMALSERHSAKHGVIALTCQGPSIYHRPQVRHVPLSNAADSYKTSDLTGC
ncbi:hypothetical protein AB4K01_13300 [Serratia fonticola]|uniref:hypothetical protein n=1 Tax=Serratia fonticola TaxID=47917 RepID=UPI0034C65D17